jgi:hypothetical protein
MPWKLWGMEVVPCILNPGSRWKSVVSFTPWPPYPRGKNPLYPFDRRLGGPQSHSRCGSEEENPCSSWESNPGHPANSLVTILTEVSQHFQRGWITSSQIRYQNTLAASQWSFLNQLGRRLERGLLQSRVWPHKGNHETTGYATLSVWPYTAWVMLYRCQAVWFCCDLLTRVKLLPSGSVNRMLMNTIQTVCIRNW